MTPRLVAITDRSVATEDGTLKRFAELGRLARPGGVVFQLRDLELGARERLEFGRAILAIAREAGQMFVVNDRIDLAVLLGADGVHLGEAGIETADARRLLGEHAYVSRACHEPERVATLEADAVLLSPIAEKRKSKPALGLAALGRARRAFGEGRRSPALFALGGVSALNAAACRTAGADGVAMVGGVLDGRRLGELVLALDIAR